MVDLTDLRGFDIHGNVDAGSADISITCMTCATLHQWLTVETKPDGLGVGLLTLAQIAISHRAECPGPPL